MNKLISKIKDDILFWHNIEINDKLVKTYLKCHPIKEFTYLERLEFEEFLTNVGILK